MNAGGRGAAVAAGLILLVAAAGRAAPAPSAASSPFAAPPIILRAGVPFPVTVLGTNVAWRHAVEAWARLHVSPMLTRLDAAWPEAPTGLTIRLVGPADAWANVAHGGGEARGAPPWLAVEGVGTLDGERLVEACATATLAAGLGRDPPDWLAIGWPQGWHPACHARNRRLLREADIEAAPDLATILGWPHVAADALVQRAWCGEAVLFLAGGDAQPLRRAIEAVRGGRVPAVDAGIERAWRDWLREQRTWIQEGEGLTPSAVTRLEARLPLVSPEDGAPRAPAALVPAAARTAAVRRAAAVKAAELRYLRIGRDPALADVADAYAFFYEGIARGHGAWRLRHRLAAAETALATLRAETAAREAWFDAVAGEMAAGAPPPAAEAGIEKSALSAYIDSVEREATAAAYPAAAPRR